MVRLRASSILEILAALALISLIVLLVFQTIQVQYVLKTNPRDYLKLGTMEYDISENEDSYYQVPLTPTVSAYEEEASETYTVVQ
jgi:hypothetical protein